MYEAVVSKENDTKIKGLNELANRRRLKENEGTYKTLVSVKCVEILTVPMWVTRANLPLGNFNLVEMVVVIEVKREMELIIWSVARVSIIHVWGWGEIDVWQEEKIE
jgi:hypothetical protein